MIKKIILLVLISSLIVLFFISTKKEEIISGSTMGTYYKINIVDGKKTTYLKNEIDKILIGINEEMSTFSSTSQISKFNSAQSTDWIKISTSFYEVTEEAIRISEISDGAFDITVKKLVDLWGFGVKKNFRVPHKSKIKNVKEHIGFKKLELKDGYIRKLLPELEIDLSAIAKGYAVDKIAEFLDKNDIKNYLVDIGGELKAKGKHYNKPWVIGIEKPVPIIREVIKKIFLCDIGVATSGNYRNYFEEDGKRYSHLIDPRTGMPINHNLVSVSVLHKSCMTADALATTLIVLGEKEGYMLAQQLGIAAFFIIQEGESFYYKTTPLFESISRCFNSTHNI